MLNKVALLVAKTRNVHKKTLNRNLKSNLFLLLLALPFLIYTFVFKYIPMVGIVMAFQRFVSYLGIFGSPWVGFKNFELLFTSPDAWIITRNTILYNGAFIMLTTLCSVTISMLLFNIGNRAALKFYQTTMLFPHFLSWVVIAFIAYSFLNSDYGILNQLLKLLGFESISWYNKSEAWIFILPLASVWKSVGYNIMMYYANLLSIDSEYFEAAKLDGANWWQISTKIMLPFMLPLITLLFILQVGQIFNADFGLFYQLPMGSPSILNTTDVIETYIFRALRELGNVNVASAVGLYKSFVGFVLVIVTNLIVRKIEPDNALF